MFCFGTSLLVRPTCAVLVHFRDMMAHHESHQDSLFNLLSAFPTVVNRSICWWRHVCDTYGMWLHTCVCVVLVPRPDSILAPVQAEPQQASGGPGLLEKLLGGMHGVDIKPEPHAAEAVPSTSTPRPAQQNVGSAVTLTPVKKQNSSSKAAVKQQTPATPKQHECAGGAGVSLDAIPSHPIPTL